MSPHQSPELRTDLHNCFLDDNNMTLKNEKYFNESGITVPLKDRKVIVRGEGEGDGSGVEIGVGSGVEIGVGSGVEIGVGDGVSPAGAGEGVGEGVEGGTMSPP